MNSKVFKMLIGILFLGILAVGLFRSFSTKAKQDSAIEASNKVAAAEKIKVLTGSAKIGFLKDPEVVKVLLDNGFIVEATKSGAFEVDVTKVNEYDAIWPAAANVAQDYASVLPGSSQIPVFSTPLAIATWTKLLPVFQANDLVTKNAEVYELNLDHAVPLMLNGTKWNQLKGNTVFSVPKSFLVNTPDIRQSATAVNYLAALAYVMNNREVPNVANSLEFGKKLAPVILKQGFQEGTLAGPFEDYLGTGMGKAPMVLIYESQFVQAVLDNKISKDKHVLIYPKPNIVLKHVVVAKNSTGKKFAELLAQNPTIQAVAAKYGFRTTDNAMFQEQMKRVNLPFYDILDIAEMPNTAVLNELSKPTLDGLSK